MCACHARNIAAWPVVLWSFRRLSLRLHGWSVFYCILVGYMQSGILYPVVVRFNNVNYAGVSTNNYGLTEVEEA